MFTSMIICVYKSTGKWGISMSEREKDIIKKLSDIILNLDKENQNYILGVAEGMAIVKTKKEANKEENLYGEFV